MLRQEAQWIIQQGICIWQSSRIQSFRPWGGLQCQALVGHRDGTPLVELKRRLTNPVDLNLDVVQGTPELVGPKDSRLPSHDVGGIPHHCILHHVGRSPSWGVNVQDITIPPPLCVCQESSGTLWWLLSSCKP